MTIAQFRPENSTRADTLYSALKSHLQDGMNMLDIGCAYACLYPLINADFPNTDYFGFDSNPEIMAELCKKYPTQLWERIIIESGMELENFISFPRLCIIPLDVAIHIGVDAEGWSPIWEVHPWLIKNHPPKVVLLESGRNDGYEVCINTYIKIRQIYIDNGYTMADDGRFDFDWGGSCLKDRHYSILTIS